MHASAFVPWYRPLVEHLPSCSTLRYRRRLRRADGESYRRLTVADDARICARLMDQVGWPVAHVVGHSYGALVALQMALDRPDRTASVALLEPAARGVSSSEQVVAALAPVIAAHRAGDVAGAVEAFLRHVCGDDYRVHLDAAVPEAYGEALGEADLFFQVEMPAVQGWSFGPEEGARISQPVLILCGAESVGRFQEGAELVQSWVPGAERCTVPHAGHLLMVQKPVGVAGALTDFLSRHPVPTSTL